LKDLALALFVGMAAGAYSSIFIATPLLAYLKMREPALQEQEKRIRARRRHQVDPYASVPAYSDDLPIAADPNEAPVIGGGAAAATTSGGNRPVPSTDAVGRGRVVPPSRGPVAPSPASGRVQPTRQARSKRGKK
jgi:preprotein translocase subunit SecF